MSASDAVALSLLVSSHISGLLRPSRARARDATVSCLVWLGYAAQERNPHIDRMQDEPSEVYTSVQ